MAYGEKTKYDLEIEAFREKFDRYKEKKIVIYGIGRRTATLLGGIKDYKIIGLLDKDISNMGKAISGIEVISMECAEREADLIVINSDPSNYEVIFKRISDSKLPVYYANGEKASLKKTDNSYQENSYWNVKKKDLHIAIQGHNVISFDFYDTLIMRRVVSPQDAFRLIDERVKKTGLEVDFYTVRQQAAAAVTEKEASLSDIYEALKKITGLTETQIQQLQEIELITERDLCVVRKDVLDELQYAIEAGKEVFIVSDMYLPKQFYMDVLQKIGVNFNPEHILISCEVNASKKAGTLWDKYIKNYVGNRKALHVGDSQEADIVQAEKYGIDTFYVMSAADMLKNSSAADLLTHAVTTVDAVLLGQVMAKLCNSPFALQETKGKLVINDCETLGYCAFGALLTDFLIWLYQNQQQGNYDRIIFFSRDGYFLKKDYEKLMDMLDVGKGNLKYLYISRRIAYLMNITDEKSFVEYVKFPYIGTFCEYVKARFDLTVENEHAERDINAATQYELLLEWLKPYMQEIKQEIQKEQLWYRQYLESNHYTDVSKKDAVVDMGFYGTNQYYYQKMVNKQVDGYYFMAYLATDNEYLDSCKMRACFNGQYDEKAQKCYVKKKGSYLESFLTAPYGMIRYVDEKGNKVCEPDKKNQEYFEKKAQTNKGALAFMRDYCNLCDVNHKISADFAGYIFYIMLSDEVNVKKDVLEGYYYDNDMVGKKEVCIE